MWIGRHQAVATRKFPCQAALIAHTSSSMDHLDAARIMAADCLCFRTRRTARAITRLYDAALRPTGLQATQVTLMNAVALGPDCTQPMGRLAEILAVEISTLTRNLRPLESAGLIEIGRNEADRRVRIVRLTGPGKARLVAALPHWNRAHAEIVATLGVGTSRALHAALDAANSALATDRPGTGRSAAPEPHAIAVAKAAGSPDTRGGTD